MVEGQDLEVLKDIPGYKAILRALIKSQMQHLVEQLATHTEEECVLLSASLSDGSLSHLGSDYGKQFLDDFDDVKKQFLGFCLKKQLKRQTINTEPIQRNEGSPTNPNQASVFSPAGSNMMRTRPNLVTSVRQRPSTSPYSRLRPHKQTPVRSSFSSPTSTVTSQEETTHEVGNQSAFGIKVEQTDISEVNKCLSVCDNPNNTQDRLESTNSHAENQGTGSLLTDNKFTNSDHVNVKQEPSFEEEPELEITGIFNPTELKDWAPTNEANAGNLFSDDALYKGSVQGLPHKSYIIPHSDVCQTMETSAFDIYPQTVIPYSQKEKKYQCTLCERRFVRKDYLNKHLLIHSGQKPYKCTECNAAFRQRSHLRLHIIKHTMKDYVQEALL